MPLLRLAGFSGSVDGQPQAMGVELDDGRGHRQGCWIRVENRRIFVRPRSPGGARGFFTLWQLGMIGF